jgi:O-antigen/teichoic acid export membrane protein
MLMPVFVLTIGVQDLLVPTAAQWYAESGLSQLTRRLLRFLLGMFLLDLVYLLVVWVCRDWLTTTVLHKEIDERDLLLMLWTLVAVIGLVRDVLQCALYALGRMKSMARQTALAAVVALLLTWFGIGWWGAPAVLIGQIAGELVNLGGIALLLWAAHRGPQPVRARLAPPRRAAGPVR